jgi:hypothetical protein
MRARFKIAISQRKNPKLSQVYVDKPSNVGYSLMRNAVNEPPKPFRVMDSRILALPDAVRGEMAASISRMRASGAWMPAPEAGCRLHRAPGGPEDQDGGSGRREGRTGDQEGRSGSLKRGRETRTAARESKESGGEIEVAVRMPKKSAGTGKNGAGKLSTERGSPQIRDLPLLPRREKRAGVG